MFFTKKELQMWTENFNIKWFIFILVLSPQSLMAQTLDEEDYFLRGLASFQKESYDSALISFTLSKGLDEKNPEVWFYSGKSYFEKARYKEAISDFLKAEDLKKGRASLMLAKSYAALNQIDKSLEYLDIHLNSNYKKPESEILLDKDLRRFENRKEWITFWKESKHYSSLDKLLAEARYMAKREDHLEAISILSDGINGNYIESPLLAERAGVYIKMGEDQPALRDLNDAIDKDRRNYDLYFQRAGVNFRLGNYEDAAEDYKRGLRSEPSRLKAYPDYALTLARAEKYEEARENILFYLNLFPEDDEAWYKFGLIHMQAGKYLDALRSLNRALGLNKADARYYLARGESYYNARTYKYASDDFSMALDLDPRNDRAYYLKGFTAARQGDREMACYCFRKAYQLGNMKAFNEIEKYCK
jgi:tetratricopeptide (TPR) repeat protein